MLCRIAIKIEKFFINFHAVYPICMNHDTACTSKKTYRFPRDRVAASARVCSSLAERYIGTFDLSRNGYSGKFRSFLIHCVYRDLCISLPYKEIKCNFLKKFTASH